jgi:hypothetical protein
MEDRIDFEITDVYNDMSNEDYHSHGAEIISSSFVKNVAKEGSIGRALKPIVQSPAMAFGTWFHDLMEMGLEGFKKSYAKLNDEELTEKAIEKRGKETKSPRATTEYKELLAAFKEENNGKEFINYWDWNSLMSMYENTQKNESYRALYETGKVIREQSIFGTHNGIRYRVRYDLGFLGSDNQLHTVVDYKTCKSLKDFRKDLEVSVKYKGGWRYDIQDVFYSDFLGVDTDNFYFFAVEKEFPFGNQLFKISKYSADKARQDTRDVISMIEIWKAFGHLNEVNNEIAVI